MIMEPSLAIDSMFISLTLDHKMEQEYLQHFQPLIAAFIFLENY